MNINSTPITLAPPLPPEEMPQAMTFFVTGPQKRLINRALREIRKRTAGDDPDARLTRGDLLTILANNPQPKRDKKN